MKTKITSSQGERTIEILEAVDFNELLDFVEKLPDESVSISLDGGMYHFRTQLERKQWVLGFQAAWDLLYDKMMKAS